LEIEFCPGKYDYDISRMTHVTLKVELYRLYDCGCFTEDDFIDYVINTIDEYKSGIDTISSLVKKIRKLRLDYTNTKLNTSQT